MKLAFFSILLLLLSITTAHSKTFKCEDIVDADMKVMNSFDSVAPTLESNRIKYNPDGTVQSVKQKVFLSQSVACGVVIDFKSDCTFSEKENGLGYSFNFICLKQKIKGNIYIDESGSIELKCSNQDHPSLFCF